MMSSSRRRRGTSPSFWRSYHNAQLIIAARCTLNIPSGILRRPGVQEVIADYEKTQTPAASNFVSVGGVPMCETARLPKQSLGR
jgi:hypothetical protein